MDEIIINGDKILYKTLPYDIVKYEIIPFLDERIQCKGENCKNLFYPGVGRGSKKRIQNRHCSDCKSSYYKQRYKLFYDRIYVNNFCGHIESNEYGKNQFYFTHKGYGKKNIKDMKCRCCKCDDYFKPFYERVSYFDIS